MDGSAFTKISPPFRSPNGDGRNAPLLPHPSGCVYVPHPRKFVSVSTAVLHCSICTAFHRSCRFSCFLCCERACAVALVCRLLQTAAAAAADDNSDNRSKEPLTSQSLRAEAGNGVEVRGGGSGTWRLRSFGMERGL